MSDELRTAVIPRTITLLDGKEYAIPPFNLNVMTAIEKEIECSMTELGERLEQRQMTTLHKLLFVLLRRYLPDLTFEQVGELVDITNLEEVSNQLGVVLTGE